MFESKQTEVIMKIFIMNRARAEEEGRKGFMKNTALISITDCGDSPVELIHKPDFLIELSFDDVPLGKVLETEYGRLLTDEEIAYAEKTLTP